jgi:hypothetical protein
VEKGQTRVEGASDDTPRVERSRIRRPEGGRSAVGAQGELFEPTYRQLRGRVRELSRDEIEHAPNKRSLTSSRRMDSVNKPSFTGRRAHHEYCTFRLNRNPELCSRAWKQVRSASPRQNVFIRWLLPLVVQRHTQWCSERVIRYRQAISRSLAAARRRSPTNQLK